MNRKAIIFGVGLNIGRSIAISLDRAGFELILVGRNADKLDSISRELSIMPVSFTLDLANRSELNALTESLSGTLMPDTVVTNLSLDYRINKLVDQAEKILDGGFERILDHLLLPMKRILGYQREIGFGRWIAIGSYSEELGMPGMLYYNLQKSLLKQFILTLAAEEGRSGITANIVSPGIIRTEKLKQKFPAEKINAISLQNTLHRIGNPEEVAAAVAFLCSRDASFITGQNILVNGGSNLGWQFLNPKK